ncbi:hypothetical protein ACHAQI_011846 [Fusarium lateritium]
MSGNPLDHSKVDPLNVGERRRHMLAVFRHLGLTFKEEWRQEAAESLCKVLDGLGFRNSSISWFEWEVDRTLWTGILNRKKFRDPAFKWPWDQEPDFGDLRAGFSPIYREWRTTRGLPVEELDPTRALKHKVPSKGQASMSGNSKSASSSALSKTPKPAAQEKYPETVAAVREAKAVVKAPVAKTKPAAKAQPAQTEVSARPATQARWSHTFASVKPRLGETFADAKARQAKELATAEKTEAAIEASVLVRYKAAKIIFNAEKVRQAEKKAAKAAEAKTARAQDRDATPVSWFDEVEEDNSNTALVLFPNHAALLRDEFGARNGLVIPPSPEFPDLEIRQLIWRGLSHEAILGPVLGCFEVAVPEWIDFHDLVCGKAITFISHVRRDSLIDDDLTISWVLLGGRPVSLVIGPNPNVWHDPKDRQLWIRVRALWWKVVDWLVYVYQGQNMRLVDWLSILQRLELVQGRPPSGDVDSLRKYWSVINSNKLKAAYDAKVERQHYDLWVPEIHAILTEPCQKLGELFEEWIGRQGPELVMQRILAVRNVWAIWQPAEAWGWCSEHHQKLVQPVTKASA